MLELQARLIPGAAAARELELRQHIDNRSARLCVIGLGYVGLTVACALARAGFRVTGIEADASRVDRVNEGIYPLHGAEPELPDLLAEQVRVGRLTATTAYEACHDADVIVIVVQTPVDAVTRTPNLEALRSAVASVGAHVRSGTMVVVESTVAPGTMRDHVVPLLEATSGLSAQDDLLVGCCPERVMPGKLLSNLGECSRVMGGWTPAAARAGAALYKTLTTGDVDTTDCLTAELVKTTENAYRDVQIAFANEVALLCEGYGADVYAVRSLVNKSPYRAMHMPGAGVGGHCIPKDPWLLVGGAHSGRPARLIPSARAINDGMPVHVGEMVERALRENGAELEGATIVLLGYTYLQDSDDTRNSPSIDLLGWLEQRGARVVVHDPFVPGLRIDLAAETRGADCLVLMVAHTAYQHLDLNSLGAGMRRRLVIDGRHVLQDAATAAGFTYRCVGVG